MHKLKVQESRYILDQNLRTVYAIIPFEITKKSSELPVVHKSKLTLFVRKVTNKYGELTFYHVSKLTFLNEKLQEVCQSY